MKQSQVILIAAAAAATGALFGILFAPRKGEETRNNIGDFVKSHCPGLKGKRLEALANQIAREVNDEV